MKLIVDENLLSFKVLEQKIFDYVCELGRQITQQILEAYDTELAESRDKKHYRGKGKRKTCIKTVYGEVEWPCFLCSIRNLSITSTWFPVFCIGMNLMNWMKGWPSRFKY